MKKNKPDKSKENIKITGLYFFFFKINPFFYLKHNHPAPTENSVPQKPAIVSGQFHLPAHRL
ncbi:hypothetical protein IXW66_23280 [Escherichia coli]|nr:hypothetical protein [Escherichia coli]